MLGYKAQSPTCFCGAVCTSIDHYTLSCAGTLSFRDRLVALLGVAISPGLYPSLLRDPRALEVLKEMVRLPEGLQKGGRPQPSRLYVGAACDYSGLPSRGCPNVVPQNLNKSSLSVCFRCHLNTKRRHAEDVNVPNRTSSVCGQDVFALHGLGNQ